jgi:hypothetical protein
LHLVVVIVDVILIMIGVVVLSQRDLGPLDPRLEIYSTSESMVRRRSNSTTNDDDDGQVTQFRNIQLIL